MSQSTQVDFNSLCLLANYERLTSNPTFAGYRLIELTFEEPFQSNLTQTQSTKSQNHVDSQTDYLSNAFSTNSGNTIDNSKFGRGFLFAKEAKIDSDKGSPEELLSDNWNDTPLGSKELETLFWETRNYDGDHQG